MTRAMLYQHLGDELAASGALTVASGSVASGSDVTYLHDRKTAKPTRFDSTSLRLTWDFSVPARVDWVAIFHHNLDAGSNVRWQMNSADDWSAPPIDVPIVIPTWRTDGFAVDPWLDLTAAVPLAANRTYRYASLQVVLNGEDINIGEISINGTTRQLARNFLYGTLRETEVRRSIRHQTIYGVPMSQDLGVGWREWEGEIVEDADGTAAVRDWWRDVGPRSFAAVFDPTVNEAAFVQFASEPLAVEYMLGTAFQRMVLSFREVSKGLAYS